jgi:hypothetical protein
MKKHRAEFEIQVRRGVKEVAKDVDAKLLREALDEIKAAIDKLKATLPEGKVMVRTFAIPDDEEPGEHYPPGGCDEPPLPPGVRVCQHLEEIVRLLREVCQAVRADGRA